MVGLRVVRERSEEVDLGEGYGAGGEEGEGGDGSVNSDDRFAGEVGASRGGERAAEGELGDDASGR